MRNLFDQYSQPENRLSHALAVCLDEDRRFLREFLAWVGVKSLVRAADLTVIEQSLPGDLPESEQEAAGRIVKRGGWVTAYAVQRHFASQRSAGIVDARLDVKLETSLWKRGRRIKYQPAWTELFTTLLRKKRGNVQFGYIVSLPWDTEGLQSRESLRLIVDSWMALAPLLDRVRGRK